MKATPPAYVLAPVNMTCGCGMQDECGWKPREPRPSHHPKVARATLSREPVDISGLNLPCLS